MVSLELMLSLCRGLQKCFMDEDSMERGQKTSFFGEKGAGCRK